MQEETKIRNGVREHTFPLPFELLAGTVIGDADVDLKLRATAEKIKVTHNKNNKERFVFCV